MNHGIHKRCTSTRVTRTYPLFMNVTTRTTYPSTPRVEKKISKTTSKHNTTHLNHPTWQQSKKSPRTYIRPHPLLNRKLLLIPRQRTHKNIDPSLEPLPPPHRRRQLPILRHPSRALRIYQPRWPAAIILIHEDVEGCDIAVGEVDTVAFFILADEGALVRDSSSSMRLSRTCGCA